MYTISQASARSGVAVPLLRAWERRYGIVTPVRTPGGYRLYDEAAIARLAVMRRLVDAGMAPAQAAAEVLRGGDLSRLAVAPAAPAVAGAADDPAGLRAALVEAAAQFDTGGIEQALDEMFSRGSFEAVVDELILPSVAALGSGWADGTLDIAAEHLASEAVQRRLATLFDRSSTAGTGQPVVVGLPPGGLHEIGTLAFAVALRRRGLDVLYLGPDVPVASWVRAVTTTGAVAAVVGVTWAADVAVARDVARALSSERPGMLVAMGGPAGDAATVGSAITLPTRVSEAARSLADRVAGRFASPG